MEPCRRRATAGDGGVTMAEARRRWRGAAFALWPIPHIGTNMCDTKARVQKVGGRVAAADSALGSVTSQARLR